MLENILDRSPIAVAWTAGIIEDEGSFVIRKNGSVCISCEMTDPDVIHRLMQWGGSVCVPAKRRDNWKQTYKWTLTGPKAVSVAEKIYPFLGARRSEQAMAMILAGRKIEQRKSDRKEETMARREQVKELHAQTGWTHQRIADVLGLNRSYVSHIIRGRYDA